MGPKRLPTIWATYMKLVTKYQISAINSCWGKCDEKWAYMFNVTKNEQSRQTGSRNLMGQKTIFRHNFLSNYWWQESDIWSQASYRYAILWEAFLDPSDSYFLFANLVGFYIKINKQEVGIWWVQKRFPRYGVPIWHLWPNIRSLSSIVAEKNVTKNVQIFSATIDDRNLIFGHKLHIGMPYCGKHFWTRQIPTSCLPT
jgi:hypothetical protein